MARILGLLGGVAALIFAWLLARRLWPQGGAWTLTAPFFLALTPILPRHAVTGLETAGFAGLLAAAVYLAAGKPNTAGRTVLTILLVLLALLRPEGAAFALLILIWRGWARRESGRAALVAGRPDLREGLRPLLRLALDLLRSAALPTPTTSR